MQIKDITPGFSVSPQINPSDIPDIAARGFRTIICNRPDGEEPDQPSYREIEAIAEMAGMPLRYIPIKGGAVSDEDLRHFGTALKDLPGPVLAFCRSGARSARLWALYEDEMRPMAGKP